MPYRSRLQKIQEKRNFNRAMVLFFLAIGLILLSVLYGIKAMAWLALTIDRLKFGDNGPSVSDTIPPPPPLIWTDFTATNSAALSISGSSEPDTKVYLMKEDKIISEKVAGTNGEVIFDNVMLDPGNNEFWAKAIDAAGNSSRQSKFLTVVFSNKKPDFTVEKPSENQKFSAKDNPIEIRGRTTPNSRVWANERLTIADSGGVFGMKFQLTEGENTLKFRVIDPAGNETEKEFKVFLLP